MPRIAPALALLLVLFGGPGSGWADEAGGRDEPAPAVAETLNQHTVTALGRSLAYTAKVGAIDLPEEGDGPAARIVYTSYAIDDAEPATRPISFVVNGGPGAASIFLHLGALGPSRVVFAADGDSPPPPARVSHNPFTWLAFTDLVFVDPPGTGYSRATPPARGGDGSDGERAAEPAERAFWNVEADLDALGGFMRQYLTRNGRWGSPKVLVGESYGGFRMARLAQRLPGEQGIAVNGVVLISPALELAFQGGADWDLLPWVLRVPSMAASARSQGKAEGPMSLQPRQDLAESEAFALGPLLTTLARGHAAAEDARRPVLERLAAMVGLPAEAVARRQGRLGLQAFAQTLLEAERRQVSVYDGAIAGPPGAGDDAYLDRMAATLASAFADYARADLGVTAALPYRILNHEAFRRWGWGGEARPGSTAPGAADELAAALAASPQLRALIAHGATDLVTPYLASAYLVDQLVSDHAARARVEVVVYPGGHMFYTRDDSLQQFSSDARAFYAALGGELAGG